MTDSRFQRRKNAAANLAVGGAMIGGSAGLDSVLERDLRRSGRPKVVRAARERSLGAVHARRMAGKVGVYGMRSGGIPLAAYGAYNLVKPDRKVKKPSVREDLIRGTARHATLVEARDKVAKKDLSRKDRRNLIDRKELGRKLSLASGTMGLTALGLRSPQAAGVVVRRVKGAKRVKPLVALANQSERATRASNTLGVLAIGTGSIGSFNYASQQRLERKQQELASKAWVNPPGVVRKDKFLRQYSQNISPKAEEGYEHLGSMRDRERGMAAGNAALGVVVGADAVRRVVRRSPKLGAAVMGTWAGMQGAQTLYNAQNARSLQRRMDKIKAKGKERAAAGELGPDRVGKALLRVPKINYTRRIGAGLTTRRPRVGGIRRNIGGSVSTFRGSVK